MKPRHSPTVEKEAIDSELIVLDTQAGQVHKLNSTAAMIFELCDGSRSPEQIATFIADACEQPQDLVLEDVEKALATFLELKLIEP